MSSLPDVDNVTTFPKEDEARGLYDRLVADDPTAPSDVAVAFLDPLAAWMIRQNPRAHPDDCSAAAEEAILALIKNPASYNPRRLALDSYLRMSAKGDLKNLLERERRHHRQRVSLDKVGLFGARGKYVQTDDDPAMVLEWRETAMERATRRPAVPDDVRAGLTAGESGVLELMRSGERKTSIYAAALGISQLHPAEQQREVKRVKDRLQKRFERARRRHGQKS